jgi:hypothetical protein
VSYTDIQICNLALAHLGDAATVASISAPSTQQEKWCATFYPMARDALLEQHNWSFGTVRKALVTSTVTPPSTWLYAYDLPAGLLNFLSVIDADAVDDYTTPITFSTVGAFVPPIIPNIAVKTSYPFVIEYDEAGSKAVLFTNLASAVGRYTITITDTTKYPMSFIEALSFKLASFLAGPLLKGDVGTKVAQAMDAAAEAKALKAEGSDANSRDVQVTAGAPWMANR